MKTCPNCQTIYTDDTLKFCLQDGTPLVFDDGGGDTSAPTVVMNETETFVKPRPADQLQFDLQNPSRSNYETKPDYVKPEERSNTFKIVALTVLTLLVILGGIGAGALIYYNGQKEVAKNDNTAKNTKTVVNPTPETVKNENAAESNSPENNSETPTPTATPEETPEINAGQVKDEVTQTINSWKTLTEERNISSYMNYYADTLDYYTKKGVSRDFVRGDKARAFSVYDSININISNMSVTPGNDGETATAVFEKEWAFEGEEKYSEGKVQTQLKLRRFGDKWKIVSERDLKTFYVNND